MDLRSGVPLWRSIDPPPIEFPRLMGDGDCDVAILGGGITGALVGYFLSKRGMPALIVDKREPGIGSTAASTGLLQYEIDTPLCDLIDKVGEAHAVHAYRRGLRAVDEIEQLVAELGADCGFSRRSTLYFASTPQDVVELRREYECRRHFGFDVHYWDRNELSRQTSLPAPAAIYSAGDGQVDPYRLTQCLVRRGCEQGLFAFTQTRVHEIVEDSDSVILKTDFGRIKAGWLVGAAGYESKEYLTPDVGTLHSTYAIASEPLSHFDGWPDGCLVWETARPYFYARQTGDGRAIIGGEDTPYRDDHEHSQLLQQQSQRLQSRFAVLFPRIEFRPAFAWAGTFGETKDGLAYIGAPPGCRRQLFALGYGGNGITFSMIAARLIADLIVGRPNDDAAVFRFGR